MATLLSQKDFGEYLVKQGLLKKPQLEELRKQVQVEQRSLEDLLTQRGIFTPDSLLKTKSEFFGFPAVNLSTQNIDKEVLKLVPLETSQYYQIVPFRRDGAEVWLAMVHPENFKAMEAVELVARQNGWKPRYAITTNEGLMQVLRQYSTLTTEVGEALKMAEGKDQEVFRDDSEEEVDFEQVLKSAPVAKMVSVILRHAVEGGASDVHIEPGEADTRVRFRVDGVLHTSLTLPKYIHAAVISRIKVLANLKIDETRLPQDGRIRLKIIDKVIDFRISTLPVVGNEKVVIN